MEKVEIFYSTCTKLAFDINEEYYGGKHYVWCAPYFSKKSAPPSSNPRDIYFQLEKDVETEDFHSDKIKANKAGIIRGAKFMLSEGKISKRQADEIKFRVKKSQYSSFKPILLIVPATTEIKQRLKIVPIGDKASFCSKEFKFEDLLNSEFHKISMKDDIDN